ncbi:MAG TPA: phosphoglucosamine mutase [Candidatus Saccharimonadales bacterium]|nr:phosphoglucosamine mutase [Candidatus Saccharimonadales bacterium]
MSSELFGTDGIRGPAGTYPLDETGMTQIGKAVGSYFTHPDERILVGWDPRESSESLVASLVKGLVAMGVDVCRVGVIPTPGLAWLTKTRQAKAGVIVTASHNPYTDNGVKIFTPDGRKLSDGAQKGLNELIAGKIEVRSPGKVNDDPRAVTDYEDFLAESAHSILFKELRIAIDSANGATSGIAARVFDRLGAQVIPLFDQPDGRNINVRCGATDTSTLRTTVKKQKLTAGIAFDGDGDRVMLVDGKGRELSGDQILYILAVAGKQEGVVATIMSNQGLETSLGRYDIGFHRTAVGDRAVLQGLDETGFRLGGEQSGHIIISEHASTGDGLLAAIQTLSLVLESGKPLEAWYDELVLVPQALINVPVQDKSMLERPDVRDFIKQETAALGDTGRLSIRPSGTEPKVRVMVEALDAEARAQSIAHQLIQLFKEGS